MPGTGDDEDPLEQAEFERAVSDFERTRDVRPSKLVATGEGQLSMLPICFAGARPTPIVWCGQEVDLYVLIQRDGRPMSRPPSITWTSSNPEVLSVSDISERLSGGVRIVGISPGEAIVIATAEGGIRQELALRVAGEPEVQWF
jgi:hypothetical protein